MEDLRQEISLQAVAQRDPLTEYQRNAYGMFDELKRNIQRDIVYQIIPVSFQYEQYLRQVVAEQQQRLNVAQQAGMTEEQAKASRTVRKTMPKLGRNDRCPCGSGKKFKDCHIGREGELLTLLQAAAVQSPGSRQRASNGGAQQPAAPSVATQLATGQAGPARPQQQAPRGRVGTASPPATNTPKANNKSAKPQAQAQRGKGAPARRNRF